MAAQKRAKRVRFPEGSSVYSRWPLLSYSGRRVPTATEGIVYQSDPKVRRYRVKWRTYGREPAGWHHEDDLLGEQVSFDRDARRKPKRDVSEQELRRQSASSLEQLYSQGRVSKKDVTRWVCMSAKGSGCIYQPTYRTGATHDRLWLRRREDLEDKLFARRTRTRRDPLGDYRGLSRASKDYLDAYVSAPTQREVVAAWRRVPERERRAVTRMLEGERPGYERIESQIASEWGDD